MAAGDDTSPEQSWKTERTAPAGRRIADGSQTDSRRIKPRESALQTHQTDTISHVRGNRPQGVDSLKQTIAAIEAACTLRKGANTGPAYVATGVREIDATLGGGLLTGAVHELMPRSAQDLTAAAGVAFGLAARAETGAAHTLYIQHDFTAVEAGRPYLPGLAHAGVETSALVYLNVPRAEDVLWAMGEALKCRGFATVIAEFPAQARVLDLTMTRRLALAAQEGGGLGLILRHANVVEPNAATTRWSIAAAPSTPDEFGGLGPACFHLDLVKNRFGQCGQWRVEWHSHDRTFAIPVSRRLVRPFADRSDRTRALAQTA
jgi:protein ImuA